MSTRPAGDLAGQVSSGTVTTMAVMLVSGQPSTGIAVWAVVSGTAASIVVKTIFAVTIKESLVNPIFIYSPALNVADVCVGRNTLV